MYEGVPVLERLRSTATPAELGQSDILMLGIGLEIGAAARGTLMGPDALLTCAGYSQSSTCRPGTRMNSRVLCVTKVRLRISA